MVPPTTVLVPSLNCQTSGMEAGPVTTSLAYVMRCITAFTSACVAIVSLLVNATLKLPPNVVIVSLPVNVILRLPPDVEYVAKVSPPACNVPADTVKGAPVVSKFQSSPPSEPPSRPITKLAPA